KLPGGQLPGGQRAHPVYGRKPALCSASTAAAAASPALSTSLPLPCAASGRPPPPPPSRPVNCLTRLPACNLAVRSLLTVTTTNTASAVVLITTPAKGCSFCWARCNSSCASLVCKPGRS